MPEQHGRPRAPDGANAAAARSEALKRHGRNMLELVEQHGREAPERYGRSVLGLLEGPHGWRWRQRDVIPPPTLGGAPRHDPTAKHNSPPRPVDRPGRAVDNLPTARSTCYERVVDVPRTGHINAAPQRRPTCAGTRRRPVRQWKKCRVPVK
ncbi:hypothetical protein GCM10022220_21680 [Actinocatenispora rupis]|uniref:Uncharacterized protein n=1 Tax=Actinocatenispora rupis TaxID=519421 RepID=A0A8J3N9U9_9ACTN|nr:hypothetical protein Aru02nite_25930 [Actinocatenispora rupis]